MASKKHHVDESGVGVSREIQAFLKKHPSLKYCQESKKIKCELSGHDIPCQVAALKSYTEGKKYLKLRAQQEFDYKKYEPHIVQSIKKSHEHQLFCKLTVRHLNRIPSHVEKHVNGRRYKKALEKYEECQRLGIKFVPPSRQRRPAGFGGGESEGDEKRFSTNPEDSGEESEAESVDSYSDLYPAADFEMDEDEGDEDVENMEVDTPNAAGDAKSTRRKGTKDQNKRHLEENEDDEDEDGDINEVEDTRRDETRRQTNGGKQFKKGKPNKWKGKQKQQQQQSNNKTDQSRTGKGKKKKKPRIM